MNVKELEKAVFWPTKNVFSHWGEYFKMACPCILLGCPQWWSWAILCFMAGYLGVEEQAALIILGNMANFLYVFFWVLCSELVSSLATKSELINLKKHFTTLD
jgi:hypothetical protein